MNKISSFYINVPDCFVKQKLWTTHTRKHSRDIVFYLGSNVEDVFNNFFFGENILSYILISKQDLIDYLLKTKDEYFNNSQEYQNDISQFYNENLYLIQDIQDNNIKMFFEKRQQKQIGDKRYYLQEKGNKPICDILGEILLPQITQLCFYKIKLDDKYVIYLKPVLKSISGIESYTLKAQSEENKIEMYSDEIDDDFEDIEEQTINFEEQQVLIKVRNGALQTQYKRQLLLKMPRCIFTGIEERKLLVACHIKEYSVCKKENVDECFDINNGLIMTLTYHTLFDNGLISFKNNGNLLISNHLSSFDKQKLQLQENKHYSLTGSEYYIQYHRENIFKFG